jgi:hypothetical protein
MKISILAIVSLLLLAACARNPRPESPEQRAQQEARYLQGGEQASAEPRTIVVREEQEEGSEQAAAPQEPPPSEAENRRRVREQARAQIREARRAAAVTMEPLATPSIPVGGGMGLLR